MFEFGIIVSTPFVPFYEQLDFFLRFQNSLIRFNFVAIFASHTFASNLSFRRSELTNWSRRRAYADEILNWTFILPQF